MVQQDPPPAGPESVNLKDPALAALLAWLFPGLGHLYQGRTGKGILLMICIMGTFITGVCIGGNSEVGYGRVVYASWTDNDKRLPYLCQIGVGLPAMPALIQASRVRRGDEPYWNGFMAPPLDLSNPKAYTAPAVDPSDPHAHAMSPTLDELNYQLSHYFELGTVYTMIAGLLNVLAIYDAWGGPVFVAAKKEEEEEEEEGEEEGEVG